MARSSCLLAPTPRRVLLLLVLLPGAAGCGHQLAAEVSGRVQLDGVPLASARVAFHPVGDGAVAYGSTDLSGEYQLFTGTQAGLAPGRYRVLVVAVEESAHPDDLYAPAKLRTPAAYSELETTPLEIAVAPGPQRIDLPLHTAAGEK